MKYKIKMITGFRRDQEHSVDSDEAHKAYYLFLHPKERGVFKTGLAIRGEDITEIVPDYQGTMGWNPTHTLDSDDWNELHSKGVDSKIRDLLYTAKQVAMLAEAYPELMNLPLLEAEKEDSTTFMKKEEPKEKQPPYTEEDYRRFCDAMKNFTGNKKVKDTLYSPFERYLHSLKVISFLAVGRYAVHDPVGFTKLNAMNSRYDTREYYKDQDFMNQNPEARTAFQERIAKLREKLRV